MMTLIFIVLFLGIFGKMIGLAIKAAWGITKIIFALVFLPVFLIALVIGGLLSLAFPILIVVGIITIVRAVIA